MAAASGLTPPPARLRTQTGPSSRSRASSRQRIMCRLLSMQHLVLTAFARVFLRQVLTQLLQSAFICRLCMYVTMCDTVMMHVVLWQHMWCRDWRSVLPACLLILCWIGMCCSLPQVCCSLLVCPRWWYIYIYIYKTSHNVHIPVIACTTCNHSSSTHAMSRQFHCARHQNFHSRHLSGMKHTTLTFFPLKPLHGATFTHMCLSSPCRQTSSLPLCWAR